MSVNISMTSLPLSRKALALAGRGWNRALRGWGYANLLAAASLEADGKPGLLKKAMKDWANRCGLSYEPLGGWVSVELNNKPSVVSKGRRRKP